MRIYPLKSYMQKVMYKIIFTSYHCLNIESCGGKKKLSKKRRQRPSGLPEIARREACWRACADQLRESNSAIDRQQPFQQSICYPLPPSIPLGTTEIHVIRIFFSHVSPLPFLFLISIFLSYLSSFFLFLFFLNSSKTLYIQVICITYLFVYNS